MNTNKASQKQANVFTPHECSLICELSNLKSTRVKITGIVLKTKFNQSYLDITITDGTGDVQCSIFLDKNLRQFYQIPKVGEIVWAVGSYNSRFIGNKVFSKIKVQRYSVDRNMDQYLQFLIQKLNQQQQGKEIEIICSIKKKVTSSKLFPREARNLIFVSALKVFEHNPEFKHWIFSKDAIKNQIYVKKYLSAKNISHQQAEKGITESILHFLKMGIICQSESNRYSIYRSVFTKIQDETIKVLSSNLNLIQTVREELLHRRLEIEKEVDFIFNAQGLTKLLKESVSDGKLLIHDTKIVLT